MQQLLQFLFKYRIFILFIVLEGACFWIIVRNNGYHGAKYFTAANAVTGGMVSTTKDIRNYFSLADKNRVLASENARLRQQLITLRDSAYMNQLEQDTSVSSIKAKVIDNSLYFRNNYLIINKGSGEGVHPGMGVVGPDGIVGQVQRATKKYATILSLLHSKSIISAKHGPTGTLCSIVWDGKDPDRASVEYLPRHIRLTPGDSIQTSGYNSVFPENTLIGVVDQVDLTTDATFYDASVDLATEFGSLSFVYILELKDKQEIDSLRNLTTRLDD